MASIYYDGKILMKPEKQENVTMDDYGYPHEIPDMYIYGCGEVYHPQGMFSWNDDSVVLVRNKKVVMYTLTKYTELLAKNEEGEIVWMDGRNAPYVNCWNGSYLDECREASEYTIVEYDIDNLEKKRYKVVLQETAKMGDVDYLNLKNFIDLKSLKMPEEEKFVIKNDELVLYKGFEEDVVIPEGVKSINNSAFRACSYVNVKSVTLPKSLTDISSWLFFNTQFKNVDVAEGNARYYTKNGMLIDRDTKTLLFSFSGDSIPSDGSVFNIGDYAFIYRKDIKEIEIPRSVEKIGVKSFYQCDALEKVVIPDTVKIIGDEAFKYCDNLSQINLPEVFKHDKERILGRRLTQSENDKYSAQVLFEKANRNELMF